MAMLLGGCLVGEDRTGNPEAFVGTSAQVDTLRPGAAGAARGPGGYLYYAVRGRQDGIHVRRMNGNEYSDWVQTNNGGLTQLFPAIAGNGQRLVIAHTGYDHRIYTSVSDSGMAGYTAWDPRGGVTSDVSPAIAWLPSEGTYDLAVYGDGSSGRGIYATRSPDGQTWAEGWTYLGAPECASSPSLAPSMRAGVRTLEVLTACPDGRLLSRSHAADGSWADWQYRGPARAAGDPADHAVSSEVGFNFVSPNNFAASNANWQYQIGAFAASGSTLAKFIMYLNGSYPTPLFQSWQFQDAINHGARTIIFRTADGYRSSVPGQSLITAAAVNDQLTRDLGDGTSLVSFIANHPATEFWIEVGNEPNESWVDPVSTWRRDLLDVIRNVAPGLRGLPNLRWMASMPTAAGNGLAPGLRFADAILDASPEASEIRQSYDAIAVHGYGTTTLQQGYGWATARETDLVAHPEVCATNQNGDLASCPDAIVDAVLAATSLPVFITERGITGGASWAEKGARYVEDLRRLPAQVRGVAFFALSDREAWINSGLGMDATAPCAGGACTVDWSFTGSRMLLAP